MFKPNIEKLEANKDIKGLVKCLKNKDDGIRQDAARALVKIGEPAVKPLIEISNSGEFDLQQPSAIWVLGEIKDPSAIEPLLRKLGLFESHRPVILNALEKIDPNWRKSEAGTKFAKN